MEALKIFPLLPFHSLFLQFCFFLPGILAHRLMLPKELVTQRKCRQQNVLISSKVESYRIRHSVRKILQERMAKGLEGRGQDVFQGKLREEILCIVESVCVLESRVLFAVSASSVCLYYGWGDSLYTNMSASCTI